MPTEDQELHLATLIVQERKVYKKLTCPTSKARQIKDEVLVVLENPWGYNLSQIRTAYPELLSTDLRELLREIEAETLSHSLLLKDIEKIEPGYRGRLSSQL